MRRQLFLHARIWGGRVAYTLARLLPIRRRVVLATGQGTALRGNLAAIRDEIARRDPSIPIVELVHTARPGNRGRILGVVHAVEAAYYLATSRLFVVDSHYLPIYVIRRRPGTTIVQTWHACAAIKRIGYSLLGKSFGADEVLTRLVRLHTNYDLVLAASAAAAEQYMDAFRQPADLFATDLGIPRTDVLIDPDRSAAAIAAVRARYDLSADRRVILYAPTFRGESMLSARDPGILDLEVMARALGEDHVLLLRLHPAVRAGVGIGPALARFVIDVSDYPEVNELMLVSDVLVTDYSSVIFEFALLGRPMAFLAPDTDAYERERGFYFDYRSGMPGPVFETTEALAEHLAHLARHGSDPEPVRAFAEHWFEVADGHSAERFVDRVVLPALDGRPVR